MTETAMEGEGRRRAGRRMTEPFIGGAAGTDGSYVVRSDPGHGLMRVLSSASHVGLVPRWQGGSMGMAKKIAAFGIAKKVYDEARKPHNQAKIRQAVQKVQERR